MKIIKKLSKLELSEKYIVKNIFGSFLVKGGSLIISLLTLPAYMRYFENQKVLGVWYTIISVMAWILNFDLGIGNGLRNNLVISLVNKDYKKAKQYISSAYTMIGGIVLLFIGVSFVGFNFINWNTFFNLDTNIVNNTTLFKVIFIVFCGILLKFFLTLITSILYALQESAIPALLSLITSILNLIYASTAPIKTIEENLVSFSVVYIIAMNLPLLICTIVVFTKKLNMCIPNIKYFNKHSASIVMKLGGTFFIVQVMYMIIMNTNEFLITKFDGPEGVVDYQIYSKLFSIIGTVFALALTPIWSAVTKAFAENNLMWVKKLFKKLSFVAGIAAISQLAMIPFLQIIVNMWLRDRAITINYYYAILFSILGSIIIWIGVISSLANGLGKLKIQAIFYTIGGLINIPISYLLCHALSSWIGVVISNIISLSAFCIVQPISITKYLNKQ